MTMNPKRAIEERTKNANDKFKKNAHREHGRPHGLIRRAARMRKYAAKCGASSSLGNKRPDLSGRPPCEGVAIGVARRGGRLNGERALRVPPCCIDEYLNDSPGDDDNTTIILYCHVCWSDLR